MWDDPRQLNAAALGLALVALVALAAGALVWLVRQPAFEFREVVVTDAPTRTSAAQLEATIRDELAGTFFTMNLEQARTALAQVPWVRKVALRREWPQRLLITIEEHEPYARWNTDALVNPQGEIFVAEFDGDLPQLDGADARVAEMAPGSANGRPVLAPLGLAVREIHVSPRGGWRLRVAGATGPLDVELGRDEPADRLARFVAVYGRTVGLLARAGTRVDRVDLRYRNGFAAHVPGFHERAAKKASAAPMSDGMAEPRHEQGSGSMVKDAKNLVVGLDIGTSKIVAIVAEVTPEGELNIIGLGTQPSRGLRRGVVVNIEATMASIQRVLEEAELMADCRITEVYTGVAGSHIRSLNSSGMVAIKEKEVTQADIDRVVETAKAVAIPNDQQILHILPQEFIIDGQEDVREPLGMSGVRLEVKVHIVTGAVSAVENIVKCVRRCGLEVRDVVLQPLASAVAVLNDDEKELGVCLMDIGGGTTDIAVFANGAIRHTAVIPIAGDQVTNDIAMTLRTPTKEAEELKLRHGCALRQLADPKDIIEVPGVGDRPPRKLSRQTLAEVIEPRIEELYTLVQAELRRSGFEELLSSGIVLTGGTALLAGVTELGEEVFHLPVRVGIPAYVGGLADVVRSPRYATAVGLLLHGRDQYLEARESRARTTGITGVATRMKQWFKANF